MPAIAASQQPLRIRCSPWSRDVDAGVNGLRGNAADHLTKDVVPYIISNFGGRADRAGWGVVGWSMGGTCAVDLSVIHPEQFSALVDISGDLTPNVLFEVSAHPPGGPRRRRALAVRTGQYPRHRLLGHLAGQLGTPGVARIPLPGTAIPVTAVKTSVPVGGR